MDRGGHHQHHPGNTPRVVARWVLLAGVLAGLFGMHMLTAGDAPGGHGAMAGHDPISAEPVAAMTDPAVTSAGADAAAATLAGQVTAVLRSADGRDGGDGPMAGCILFLVVGGAALLLALLMSRRATLTARTARVGGVTLTDVRRRGPPGLPRVALCVIRI